MTATEWAISLSVNGVFFSVGFVFGLFWMARARDRNPGITAEYDRMYGPEK